MQKWNFFFFRLLPSGVVRGRQSGFSISINFVPILELHPPLSLPSPLSPHPYTFFSAFPISSFRAVPSSAIFCQHTQHLSSVHDQITPVLPCDFSPNRPTCAVALVYSFLILSILVTPNENRNSSNSAEMEQSMKKTLHIDSAIRS